MKSEIEPILRNSVRILLERFERNAERYPFVDTKFNIVSGRDFGDADEPFRRRDCIYSWIQGRGLESLAKHAAFFERKGDPRTAERLDRMTAAVAGAMELRRAANTGRLPFAMHLDGSSFFPQEPSDANFSDLFYSKGLFAAARRLKNKKYEEESEALFLCVIEAVRSNRFRTDQHGFDPKNPVAFVEGKFPQGPRMIALSGLADFAASGRGGDRWLDTAEEFIRFVFDHHVNLGKYPGLRRFDFIESIGKDGRAWRDGERIFCDPGHALEFVGLASKCLLAMRRKDRHHSLLEQSSHILPDLFCHVFDCGFNSAAGGICKGFDLTARTPVNSDMPWWSLPETVRAGVELSVLFPEIRSFDIAVRTGAAFQAFRQGFLLPSGFACQTRSAEGKVIDVIPAVPDADPGYHTNLSLMDALELSPEQIYSE